MEISLKYVLRQQPWVVACSVAGSVKMIRFSYSNEDTKDEEEKRGLAGVRQPLSRRYAPSPRNAP